MSEQSNDQLKVLVIGAGGRLGGEIARSYAGDHSVTGLSRGDLDLTDEDAIRKTLSPMEFDRVILTAALTAVDYCETHEDEAFAINGDAPGVIAEICFEKGAHLTYISTDFVFDGLARGAYRESQIAMPLSVYGASKLEGEEQVLAVSPDHLVARVSWLYGSGRPAFPEWIIGQAEKNSELSLPAEKLGTPTSSRDVAEFLKPLAVPVRGEPAGGIYHLSNSGSCSWREWGQACLDEAIARGLPLKAESIGGNCLEDIAAFVARRPINSVLDSSKLTATTGIVPRHWRDALRDHFDTSPLFSNCSAECQ